MNLRIQELSEQAHRSTTNELAHLQRVHNRTYDLYESAAIYNEKFAQLIVQECCRVMESLPPSTYHVGRTRMSEEIKQHFGVEE